MAADSGGMEVRRAAVAGVAVVVVTLAVTAVAAVTPVLFGDVTGSDRATVTLVDDRTGETLGVVRARVADSPGERYTGLSETESLANGSGMLFVYEEEARRTFVMREMAFPIDMVFVASNGTITEIHHARVEDDQSNLTNYRARAQWVLEVPYDWTVRRNVTVGDEVRIEYPENVSVTPTPSDG